jgi:GLPGLI family protein
MKHYLILTALLSCCWAWPASAQFTLQGKIDYERKVNMHRQVDDWQSEDGSGNAWLDAMKSKMPKFITHHFHLSFTRKQSKYVPVKQEEDPSLSMIGGLPGTENQVWNNYESGNMIAAKKVYEQGFLVADSMKQFQWKLLDEIRTIAGYSCRKAVCKINDSVVVVAFYTDKIPVSGGPELFSGLPGMILEIAIPRLNTTWIAVNVILQEVGPADLTPPDKGKKTNLKDLQKTVRSSTKDWGKFADKSIWWSTL